MNVLSAQIRKVISDGLPGPEAQLKLSPEARKLFAESEIKTNAAILILLYKDIAGILSTVFMKRQTYNGPHSAQISFPGGKFEPDDGSLSNTALRESQEEIGIVSDQVEIIGKLTELYIPVSNFLVHPFIGITLTTPEFKIDKSEVDYLITIPIQELINLPVLFTKKEYEQQSFVVPYYNINKEMIWGATAMILCEFIEVLKKIPKLN
jgi:8-oxo-dGTP pyrophosphatase MutT (NUDIX family)